MQKRTFTLLLILSFPFLAMTQVVNDECVNAIRIQEVSNFCSTPGAFSNQGASQSAETDPLCFPPEAYSDVWFVFTAIGTDASITIKGPEQFNAGGTLRTPQFVVYSGTCGALNELQCTAPLGTAATAQSFTANLVIGEDYYIRVSAAFQREGTFQLCINNFNAIPALSSDCATGLVLCDKSPFTVPSVTTAGNDPNEITGIECSPGAPVTEAQSTWFKWVCEESGTLEFDIDPIDSDDDIDFILYELPNGLENCNDKIPRRIMLSGANNGDPLGTTWAQCIGTTGLRAGSSDERENCGCSTNDDNFIRPMDMVAGRAYALVVLNFTESGSGFTLEFGGTGTFQGPAVDFTTNLIDLGQTTACVGQEITFTDASSFVGGLTDWSWNFGSTASQDTANTAGPHNVSFNRPGIKPILLSVTSVDGCIVSQVIEVEVVCCDDHFEVDALVSDATCPDAADGAIDLSANSDFGVTDIRWSNGAATEDIMNLERGPYEVSITDAATCTLTRTIDVGSPDTFQIAFDVTMPTCGGGEDGAINLSVQGAQAPYQFNWEGRGLDENIIDSLEVGDYTVTVSDVNNCSTQRTIEVRELELVLDPAISSAVDPSCTDIPDGLITVNVNNGLGPYEYDWEGNGVFQDENSLQGLSAGVYTVQVRDDNRCLGDFSFSLNNPAPVEVDFEIDQVSCFGEQDASITAFASGGTMPYNYSWNTGVNNATIGGLGPGNYTVSVVDANGCPLDSMLFLDQPDTIFFNNIQVENVLCFGEPSGRISILGGGGTPPYDFRISNQGFIPDNTFLNLPAGTYQVELRDAEGCSIGSTATITEPPLLTVDAGENRIVELGDQTLLQAISSEQPVTYLWSREEDLTCANCPDPLALPLNSATYTISVTNNNGCIATDDVSITVSKPRRIFAPTAFSPNNDGTNDFFTIYGDKAAVEIVSLKIFDRWGELLFNGLELPLGEEALGWDGTHNGEPMNSGVYIYMAEIEFLDGEIVIEQGDLLLAR